MSIEKAIEEKIRQAIERGDFDNLKGSGKPIDLDAYFATPEDLRMAFAMLKSNDFVPEEVQMFTEIAELKEKLAAADNDADRDELRKKLHERGLALSILLDKRRRR